MQDTASKWLLPNTLPWLERVISRASAYLFLLKTWFSPEVPWGTLPSNPRIITACPACTSPAFDQTYRRLGLQSPVCCRTEGTTHPLKPGWIGNSWLEECDKYQGPVAGLTSTDAGIIKNSRTVGNTSSSGKGSSPRGLGGPSLRPTQLCRQGGGAVWGGAGPRISPEK